MAETVTLSQFRVYMGEFEDAIGVVSTQSGIVHETLADIEHQLGSVSQLWQSPAADTFDPLRAEFHKSSADLGEVLTGILHRMRITYQNYVDAERKAVQNLTAHEQTGHHSEGPPTGGGSAPGHGSGQPAAALNEARHALHGRIAASVSVTVPGDRETVTLPRTGRA